MQLILIPAFKCILTILLTNDMIRYYHLSVNSFPASIFPSGGLNSGSSHAGEIKANNGILNCMYVFIMT